jgi:hypothetical protein
MTTAPKINDVLAVKATPHKRFFIDMITRDISLEACVLDLIDNSVDGATRSSDDTPPKAKTPKPHPLSSGGARYKGYKIDITCSSSLFRISDNCGGISIDIAREYAFNFGRDPREHTDADTESGIGIYGIGMKRALFKMGKHFAIQSHTNDDAFVMDVDVDTWAAHVQNWDLELKVTKASAKSPGTTIEVTHLRPAVAHEFATTGFSTRLVDAAARTYAAFLDQGLEMKVNGTSVRPTDFTFLDGRGFRPLHERSSEQMVSPSGKGKNVVEVEIWAGAASGIGTSRPDVGEDDDTSLWGWYVLCNNRVVLSADKTERTGWGLAPFPQWHPQYNGFIGIVSFRSDEPYALPWTTTKNDVDIDSLVYRKARSRMQAAAREYIKYSRVRKANPESAKKIERSASSVKLTALSKVQPMKTPPIPGTTQGTVNIAYQKPKRDVAKVAAALGDPSLSAAQVGIQTFDYYYTNEVE